MMFLRKSNRNATIESKVKLIKQLTKLGANLEDPNLVEILIAKSTWNDGRKRNAVYAYLDYLRMQGKDWDPPKYQSTPKIPYVPPEKRC